MLHSYALNIDSSDKLRHQQKEKNDLDLMGRERLGLNTLGLNHPLKA